LDGLIANGKDGNPQVYAVRVPLPSILTT